MVEYLLAHECVDCGESDVRVLEFDHVSGTKSRDVTQMVQHGYSIAALEAEAAKCDIRCANCHRRRSVQGTVRDF